MVDPDAAKPDDWDEDAPRQIEDEDAEKPDGWLDEEPAEIDDPGEHKYRPQYLGSEKSSICRTARCRGSPSPTGPSQQADKVPVELNVWCAK